MSLCRFVTAPSIVEIFVMFVMFVIFSFRPRVSQTWGTVISDVRIDRSTTTFRTGFAEDIVIGFVMLFAGSTGQLLPSFSNDVGVNYSD
jgi:hypothetical protein